MRKNKGLDRYPNLYLFSIWLSLSLFNIDFFNNASISKNERFKCLVPAFKIAALFNKIGRVANVTNQNFSLKDYIEKIRMIGPFKSAEDTY